MTEQDGDDGVTSIASDDSTVVPILERERRLRRDQEEVNQQVNDLLQSKSRDDLPINDVVDETIPTEDDIIDIPYTTVEGTHSSNDGEIASRTRSRRATAGKVLSYLDSDWKDKVEPPKFNKASYWNSIIMTHIRGMETTGQSRSDKSATLGPTNSYAKEENFEMCSVHQTKEKWQTERTPIS